MHVEQRGADAITKTSRCGAIVYYFVLCRIVCPVLYCTEATVRKCVLLPPSVCPSTIFHLVSPRCLPLYEEILSAEIWTRARREINTCNDNTTYTPHIHPCSHNMPLLQDLDAALAGQSSTASCSLSQSSKTQIHEKACSSSLPSKSPRLDLSTCTLAALKVRTKQN